jgi:hypothetical protein
MKRLVECSAYTYANNYWNKRNHACSLEKLAWETLMLVYYFSTVLYFKKHGLKLLCWTYTIDNTIWKYSKQALKSPSSNYIYGLPL